jgi:hypothetical protein
MKKLIFAMLFFVVGIGSVPAQLCITEIDHYYQEKVEIVGPTGTSLAGVTLNIFDGAGNLVEQIAFTGTDVFVGNSGEAGTFVASIIGTSKASAVYAFGLDLSGGNKTDLISTGSPAVTVNAVGNIYDGLTSIPLIATLHPAVPPFSIQNTVGCSVDPVDWARENPPTFGSLNAGASYSTVLPVELTSFTAKVLGSKVLVSATFASQENHFRTHFQKSFNGKDFETFASTPGAGTTYEEVTYEAYDMEVKKGVTYYRLVFESNSGEFEFSNVVSVSTEGAEGLGQTFKILENPGSPTCKVLVIGEVSQGDALTIRVVDILGRTSVSSAVAVTGLNEIKLPGSGTFAVSLLKNGIVVGESEVYIAN